MTYEYVLKKVQVIVSDQFGCDTAQCGPDIDLGRDLGGDSLDLVSIVLDVETELAIKISEDDTDAVHTVGDLAAAAARALDVEVPA
ncbi:phosphopantetheine-binding protein [Roseobacter sp.]|uniref:phosphopantetheine-binding protein n=1 Tax=Roseobacter sp. TaxID=1907202 RepID=UPI00296666E5|nr:phosphopantetheine-binding protein [Roseobacter sp.]MDW3181750.1 phosphopantetheine-binding protein [Roseobacter sp.]